VPKTQLVSDEVYEKSFEACRFYIDNYCIWRSKNGETIPAKETGKSYRWQFYLRKALFEKRFISTFTHLFVYHIEKEIGHFDFQIAGLETAATPLVSALPITCQVLYNIDINGFSVRKERKEYGLKNWIEGNFVPEKKVLIVDDLSASGNSIEKCYDILLEHNANIENFVFSCVDKMTSVEQERYGITLETNNKDNLKIISPFNLDHFKLKE